MNLMSRHTSHDVIVGYINNGALQFHLLEITISATHKDKQSTGSQRNSQWISNILNNSLLISSNDSTLANWKQTQHQNILILPTESVDDDAVTEMLYYKLSAISEACDSGIEQVSVNNVQQRLSTQMFMDNTSTVFYKSGWWHDDSPNWLDAQTSHLTDGEKIIKLIRVPSWVDFDNIEIANQHENVISFTDET